MDMDILMGMLDPLTPRLTYLGYPHFVYIQNKDKAYFPCTVEIITYPNGEESLGWHLGKDDSYRCEDYDFYVEGY